MEFLADESFDFRLVRALRAAGHDVIALAELAPRAEDEQVISLAAAGNRILLTEDKDFGWLVYVSALASQGVILVRCAERERGGLAEKLAALIGSRGQELRSSFVVVTPRKARFSKLPKFSG